MRSAVVRGFVYVAGVAALVMAQHAVLQASSITAVPEVDGATMATGLGALAAGVLMLRAYWRSR
jgi:hypothetical protein